MIARAPQPAEKALQQLDIQAIGLGAPMLARDRHARGVDEMASMPRARSQRASQKPSRPASKATAMRVIVRPVLAASSRQRGSSRGSSSASGASFFRGWRSTPGTIAPTSQLAWLISITAINVLSWSRAVRARLNHWAAALACSIAFFPATMVPSPRRPPHTILIHGESRDPTLRSPLRI
jgi:hypothetical protein